MKISDRKPSSICLKKTSSLTFSQQPALKPSGNSRSSVQALFNLIGFSPLPVSDSFADFASSRFCLFLLTFLSFCFSNSHGHHQSNFLIRSDFAFLSSSPTDSFLPNSCRPDVHRSNASLEPNWRRLFHALNSASQSDPAKVTAQEGENASPAMSETLPGTTTKDRLVPAQAPASMRVNSESSSNEIDESDSQDEKHNEQRI
jgi:hypothetical protein